jgi:hypothetical protein
MHITILEGELGWPLRRTGNSRTRTLRTARGDVKLSGRDVADSAVIRKNAQKDRAESQPVRIYIRRLEDLAGLEMEFDYTARIFKTLRAIR